VTPASIYSLIENLQQSTGGFQAEPSRPCIYDHARRQWQKPVPFWDKVGAVYIIADRPSDAPIEKNYDPVLYAGKTVGDIRGRLNKHRSKLMGPAVAYVVKIDPYYWAKAIESCIFAVAFDEGSYEFTERVSEQLLNYNLPLGATDRIRTLLPENIQFKVAQIKEAIAELEKQAIGIDDTHRFGILYETISSAFRLGKTTLRMLNREFGSI
jgi:hypothetical protein